jgi:predicted nucleic acid-binding protein
MLVVVDANELFSLLIKGSKNSEYIFFSNRAELIAPEFLLIEFEKYREEILDKTHRSTIELSMLLSVFKRRIKFIPEQEFKDLLKEAAASLPEDPKDAPYVALAMKYNAVIWSEDKVLKRRSPVKVSNTGELLKKLKEPAKPP